MATGDYVTTDEFKQARRIGDSLDDAQIAPFITAASRQVDTHCGRRFYLDTEASTRTYEPSDDCELIVDDFGTTTGLVVVESGTTLTLNTHFYLHPLNGLTEWGEAGPYYVLEKFNDQPWLDYDNGGSISVTAKWGWPAVPEQVKQATIMLTADLMASRDNAFGVVGLDAGAAIRMRMNSTAAALLASYRRGDTAPAFGLA